MTSMAETVAESLKTAPTQPEDAAARLLAEKYAKALDDGGDDALAELGPKLLAVLTALGATPAGRKSAAKGGETNAPDPARDQLAALRAARGAASRAN